MVLFQNFVCDIFFIQPVLPLGSSTTVKYSSLNTSTLALTSFQVVVFVQFKQG